MSKKTRRSLISVLLSLVFVFGVFVPIPVDYLQAKTDTSFTIDADKSDWDGIDPLMKSTTSDEDKAAAIGDLYLENDEDNLYSYIEAVKIDNWGAEGMHLNLAFNINDKDSGLGTNVWAQQYNYTGMENKPQFQMPIRIKEDKEVAWFELYKAQGASWAKISDKENPKDIEVAVDRTKGFEVKIPLDLLGLEQGDSLKVHAALGGNNDSNGAFDVLPDSGENEFLTPGEYNADPANVQKEYSEAFEIIRTDEVEPEIESPVVHEDRTVTFNYQGDGSETSVKVAGDFTDWQNGALELSKGENNLWTLTVEALDFGTHEYKFIVNGDWIVDPLNEKTAANGNSVFTIVNPDPELKSPIIHEDRTVTFNYLGNGSEDTVRVAGDFTDWENDAINLSKGENNLWSITVGPLNYGDYEYKFIVNVDGWKQDPLNPKTRNKNSFFTIEDPDTGELESPVIHDDNTVSFYYKNPDVDEVYLRGNLGAYGEDWDPGWEMEKDENGIFSYTTTTALTPGTYEYKFFSPGYGSDNGWLNDPLNPNMQGDNNIFTIEDTEPSELESPVIHDDDTVSFYYKNPDVNVVYLRGNLGAYGNDWDDGWKMEKDENGVFSYTTTKPLEPGQHQYKFFIEDTDSWIRDPLNDGPVVDDNSTFEIASREYISIETNKVIQGEASELETVLHKDDDSIEEIDNTDITYELAETIDGVSLTGATLTVAASVPLGTKITVNAEYKGLSASQDIYVVETLYTYKVHYYRYDGKQMDWDIWAFNDSPEYSEDGHAISFTEQDEDGFAVAEFVEAIPEITIITRPGNWSTQEEDRYIYMPEGEDEVEVFIKEGDSTVYYSREDININAAILSAFMDSKDEILVNTSNDILDEVVDSFKLIDAETEEEIPTTALKTGAKSVILTLENPDNFDVSKNYIVSAEGFESCQVTMRGILDAKDYYYDGDDLGLTYSNAESKFKVWAPTAKKVSLALYDDAGEYDANGKVLDHSGGEEIAMTRDNDSGVWAETVTGDLDGKYYIYKVEFADGTVNYAVDPYAKAVSANGQRGAIIDLAKTNPAGFDPMAKPQFVKATDAIIYELHVRDFSINKDSGMTNKGKYKAFTESGTTNSEGYKTGIDHLEDLGITHVQLLPVYDFATVNELEVDNPNSDQAKFNWGYDPQNYNVPEGSYSTDPTDPYARITELKEAIQSLHNHGIRVVMDVVYNHTYSTLDSSFEKIVPNYYHRTNDQGQFTNGSGTGNEVASERPMVRKFIKDSVRYWVEEYGMDGFRFDLMGLIDTETMEEIVNELHNEVDPSIIIHGEPWTGGSSALDGSRQTTKGSQKGKNFAVFNDNFRDGIKGDTNGAGKGFTTGADGVEDRIVSGVEGAYNDFTAAANETINYATAHDNLNLWDKVIMTQGLADQEGFLDINEGELVGDSAAQFSSIEDAVAAATPHAKVDPEDPLANETVRRAILSNGIVLTSQGISFMHAGDEILRTKYGDYNSYSSPDAINQIRWDDKSSFNEVNEYYKGLIKLRKTHPAFRMTYVSDIQNNLEFLRTNDKLVAFTLKDYANGDTWENIVVIYNANETKETVNLPHKAEWNVVVDETAAGTESLETVNGSSIEVAPLSITVLYENESEFTPKAERLEVEEKELNLVPGDIKQINARVYNQRDGLMPEAEINYSSSNEEVVNVSATGRVEALEMGDATITVSVEGLDPVEIPVSVYQQEATSIEITGPDSTFEGQTISLMAKVLDQNEETMEAELTWSSSDEDIARVNSKGLVTGVKAGTAIISATVDGTEISAEKEITVEKTIERKVQFTYIREDEDYTDWDLWLWDTGAQDDAHEFEVKDGIARTTFDIGPGANRIGFIVRKGGDDWLIKDGDNEDGGDRFIDVYPKEPLTKVEVYGGQDEFLTVPSLYELHENGPKLEDGKATIYYRDQDLYEENALDTIDSVDVVITLVDKDGKEDTKTFAMEYDETNEYFTYTLPELKEGTYKYEFNVTKDGQTETGVKDPYYEPSEFTYSELDLDIEASISADKLYPDDNAVISVEVKRPEEYPDLDIEVFLDLSAIGGDEAVAVDPELKEQAITVASDTTSGIKEIPVIVKDEFGGRHETTISLEVLSKEIGQDIATDFDEALIYFMLTDRFADGDKSNNNPNNVEGSYDPDHLEAYHGGDFQGIINNLDYLEDLGINTIWITPIVKQIETNQLAGSGEKQYAYHGYWAEDFTEIDPHLGDLDKFKELLDKAHDRNIKIMVDVVLNHAGYGMENDPELGSMIRKNPVEGDPVKENVSGLPDFETERPEVRNKIVSWYTDMLKNTKTDNGNTIDYFRVDTVKHVDHTILRHFKNEMAKLDPEFKMIGEYFGGSIDEHGGHLNSGELDSILDFKFKDTAAKFINGDIEAAEASLEARNEKLSSTATVGQFLSSHDEDGFLISRANNDEDLFKAAVALQLTAKGQVVIYYGEEIGMSGLNADFNNGRFSENRKDFDWSKVRSRSFASHPLRDHYKKLLDIRSDYSKLFARGDRKHVAGSNDLKYTVFSRSYGDETAYVGINIDKEAKDVELSLDPGTEIKDIYNDVKYTADADGKVIIDLPGTVDGGTFAFVLGSEEEPYVPDNEKYTPTVVSGKEVDAKTITAAELIANKDELPEGTKYEFSLAPDASKPGKQSVAIRVTYPDGTFTDVYADVIVLEEPTELDKDKYNPVVSSGDEIDPETVTAADLVLNKDELPEGTKYEFIAAPDAEVTGEQVVVLRITYPDGSYVDVNTAVIVKDDSGEEPTELDKDKYDPVVSSGEEIDPETVTATDLVLNKDELPEGTKYEFIAAPDAEVTGEQTVVIRITYPDGSYVDVVTAVIVKDDSGDEPTELDKDKYNPVVSSGEEIDPETITAADLVLNKDELPADTKYEFIAAPDAEVTGEQTVVIRITYPDGSYVDVVTSVVVKDDSGDEPTELDKDKYNPVVSSGEKIDPETVTAADLVLNKDELPADTKYEFIAAPDAEVTGEQTVVIRITYPDGSYVDVVTAVVVKDDSGEEPTELDKDKYNPIVSDREVVDPETVKAEDLVLNKDELPEGTKYEFIAAPIVDKIGEQSVVIRVTYPDGSYVDIVTSIVVREETETTDTEETTDTTEETSAKEETDEDDKVAKSGEGRAGLYLAVSLMLVALVLIVFSYYRRKEDDEAQE